MLESVYFCCNFLHVFSILKFDVSLSKYSKKNKPFLSGTRSSQNLQQQLRLPFSRRKITFPTRGILIYLISCANFVTASVNKIEREISFSPGLVCSRLKGQKQCSFVCSLMQNVKGVETSALLGKVS